MLEINDDLFNHAGRHNALVITTNNVIKSNGELVMGAGIALEATKRYPGIAQKFADEIKRSKMIDEAFQEVSDDYNIACVRINNQPLIALQTKRHWKNPSPIDLVVQSCQLLFGFVNCYEQANENPDIDIKKVYMSRPGCGNGGLDWNYVKPLISFLDDRFIVCHKEK